MKLRTFIFLFTFALFTINAFSQYGTDLYITDRTISESDSGKLFFRARAFTFLDNKEHFNNFQPGYTLLGSFFQPRVEYHSGPNTRITAGAHLLAYSGIDRYSQIIPLFSVHHKFSPAFELVAGTLYGAHNHGLIEPLYRFNRVFTDHNESGLQVFINHYLFKADVWLNWEKFIFTNDPFQEEFTFGVSSVIMPQKREGRLNVEFPVQLLLTHKGGQIDNSGQSLQSIINFAAGVNIDYTFENSFVEIAGFRGYIATFKDISNNLEFLYETGSGFYPNLYLKTRWFEAGAGYWLGNRFVAPRGEPIFQSVSQVNPDVNIAYRDLITSKIIFNYKIMKGINLGLRFDAYYDPLYSQFDHTGGLHIIIDERFFITNLKKR